MAGNHVLQGVVKRLQVRVYLVPSCRRAGNWVSSGLYGGTVEDYFSLSPCSSTRVRQGRWPYRSCPTRQAYGKYHVVPAKCLYQFQLVFAARNSRLSVTLNTMIIARLLSLWAFPLTISMMTSSFRELYSAQYFRVWWCFLQTQHLLFISQHPLMTLPRATMRSLGYKAFYQLHIGVVYAVKDNRVDILKNNQFFYHRYVL